jgi:hypothetical protein
MDAKQFWDIIEASCSDPRSVDDWNDVLFQELARLRPEAILQFDRIFDELACAAYTVDLWGAAYLINGGASDDGFYYFRCWLIGMGKQAYENALADPDTLADVVVPDLDGEAEIYAEAQKAWERVTGEPNTEYPLVLPARCDGGTLRGKNWDFDDDAEMRKRFPRLSAIYLEQ